MSTNAPPFRQIEFNALDPRTRRRLIEAIEGQTSPRPILSQPSSTGGAMVGWLLSSLMGIAGLVGVAIIEFGSPYDVTQPWPFLFGYALGLFLLVWGVLRAIRTGALSKALPFQRGRYVFPTDLVIAETSRLTIVPMGRLVKLDGVHRHVNGVYQATDLTFDFEGYGRAFFSVRGKALAEQIMDDLRHSQQRISEAVQFQDIDVLAAMDVFFEARATPVWNDPSAAAQAAKQAGSTDVSKPVSPLLERAALLAAGAMLLAPPLWLARNFASDEAAYAEAQNRNRTYVWEAYMRADGRHDDEVEDRWLPEAAFAEAQREGTVAALRDFVRAHPDSARVDEARAAIHERFVQVRQDFVSQAATADPRMPTFMGHLLDWLEANDSPPVQVRFFAPSAESLAMIDENLDLFGEVQGVTGGIAPVAPHFTPARSESRERHITEVLQRGFSPIFPSDVMQLTHAGRIAPAQQGEAITQPTFDVSYSIRPSGSVYTSDTSNRGFVGIHVDFHIQMRIPDSAETFGFDVNVEPPEHFTVTSYDTLGFDPNGDSAYQDGLVYSVMGNRAFDNLGNQLALTFFRPETPAYRQAQAAAERERRGDAAAQRPAGLPAGLPPGLLDDLGGGGTY
ncbi:MAG TPA: hypothetical protein RMH99_13640 [Sandaracinaceae bacterium LLY-WYZ-13_1]|nr:hypothetical protein [Sandaracinaceae bacterium LLY-WYZ-13_1]